MRHLGSIATPVVLTGIAFAIGLPLAPLKHGAMRRTDTPTLRFAIERRPARIKKALPFRKVRETAGLTRDLGCRAKAEPAHCPSS